MGLWPYFIPLLCWWIFAVISQPPAAIFLVTSSEWTSLNESVGGRLYAGMPLAKPCYLDYYDGNSTKPGWSLPDAGTCYETQTGKTNSSFLTGTFGGYRSPNYASCMSTEDSCYLNPLSLPSPINPLRETCHQGSVANYYIDVRQVSDVQFGLDFASKHNVPLVIKNTGHDFKGRSSAPYSLALWMHNVQPEMQFSEYFVPDGCDESAGPALTFGAGQQFDGIYRTAHEHGYAFVGGSSGTVGTSGGWIQGGGHSPIANTYGLGVDNVLQFRVVLPNGTYITINRCQNQDMFFALRGGGGGTFGIVMETTSRLHKEVPMQLVTFQFVSRGSESDNDFMRLLVDNAPTWADEGWGGSISSPGNGVGLLRMMTPSLTLEQAAISMRPVFDFADKYGIFTNVTVVTAPSVYWEFYENGGLEAVEVPAGFSYAMGSRLIPRESFIGEKREELLTALQKLLLNGARHPVLVFPVTPASYQLAETDLPGGPGESSIHPAWRTALWHIIVVSVWNPTDETAGGVGGVANAYKLTTEAVQPLRDITPDSGAYQNEADVFEPGHIAAFWGWRNYERLLAIKKRVDPDNILACHQCVGWDPRDPRFDCYPEGIFTEARHQ